VLKDLIESTNYIETFNRFDNLINELIYSQNTGFINLRSKEALDGAKTVLEKFDFEADKITKENGSLNIDSIVSEKRNELIKIIEKHYIKEAKNWAYDAFNNMIDNCILQASIYNDDSEFIDKIYKKGICAISWISDICAFDENDKNKVIKKFDNDFNNAIKAKDNDFIDKTNPSKSDYELFLKLRSYIASDTDSFLALDFDNFKLKLSVSDINYFQKQKNLININKTKAVDEILLVDCAIEKLNIKSNEEKYKFIQEIKDEFQNLKEDNLENKIEIIKRRMQLFQNETEYFKKLLEYSV